MPDRLLILRLHVFEAGFMSLVLQTAAENAAAARGVAFAAVAFKYCKKARGYLTHSLFHINVHRASLSNNPLSSSGCCSLFIWSEWSEVFGFFPYVAQIFALQILSLTR